MNWPLLVGLWLAVGVLLGVAWWLDKKAGCFIVLSLETAQKLRDAGLEWEPKILTGEGACDQFYWPDGTLDTVGHRDYRLYVGDRMKQVIWAPRLDQLLAELEARGRECALRKYGNETELDLFLDADQADWKTFKAEDPAEATALGLLWVIEQERGRSDG